MISYENFKTWVEKNRMKLVYGIGLVLMFFIGFGTGNYTKPQNNKTNSLSNYTTKSNAAPATAEGDTVTGQVAGTTDTATPATNAATAGIKTNDTNAVAGDCAVKGNPSSKIYHLPGGAFYDRLKSPRCFSSEAAAKAAGYRKSSR